MHLPQFAIKHEHCSLLGMSKPVSSVEIKSHDQNINEFKLMQLKRAEGNISSNNELLQNGIRFLKNHAAQSFNTHNNKSISLVVLAFALGAIIPSSQYPYLLGIILTFVAINFVRKPTLAYWNDQQRWKRRLSDAEKTILEQQQSLKGLLQILHEATHTNDHNPLHIQLENEVKQVIHSPTNNTQLNNTANKLQNNELFVAASPSPSLPPQYQSPTPQNDANNINSNSNSSEASNNTKTPTPVNSPPQSQPQTPKKQKTTNDLNNVPSISTPKTISEIQSNNEFVSALSSWISQPQLIRLTPEEHYALDFNSSDWKIYPGLHYNITLVQPAIALISYSVVHDSTIAAQAGCIVTTQLHLNSQPTDYTIVNRFSEDSQNTAGAKPADNQGLVFLNCLPGLNNIELFYKSHTTDKGINIEVNRDNHTSNHLTILFLPAI